MFVLYCLEVWNILYDLVFKWWEKGRFIVPSDPLLEFIGDGKRDWSVRVHRKYVEGRDPNRENGNKSNRTKQNRSTEGCSKLKRSVDMTSSGKMVSTLEQMQVQNGTGPGFRRSNRPLFASRTCFNVLWKPPNFGNKVKNFDGKLCSTLQISSKGYPKGENGKQLKWDKHWRELCRTLPISSSRYPKGENGK